MSDSTPLGDVIPLGERSCRGCFVKIATAHCNHVDNDGERVIIRQSVWEAQIAELWQLRNLKVAIEEALEGDFS